MAKVFIVVLVRLCLELRMKFIIVTMQKLVKIAENRNTIEF